MISAMVSYTRGHDAHCPAQISAMPPDRIIARR